MYFTIRDKVATFPRIRGGDPEFFRDENVDNALFPAYAGVIPRLLTIRMCM